MDRWDLNPPTRYQSNQSEAEAPNGHPHPPPCNGAPATTHTPYLLRRQVLDLDLPPGVHQLVSVAVQVLPYQKCVHGTHVEAGQGILGAKHVLVGILADLLKEPEGGGGWRGQEG